MDLGCKSLQNGISDEKRENIVDYLRETISNDLAQVYVNLVKSGSFGDLEFYRRLLSSNPKRYPTSGLQHFIGSGLVAARLASFLDLDDYRIIVAFLSGVLHDLHKLSVSLEREKDSIYKDLQKTTLYKGLLSVLDEKEVENAFLDALELSFKLWSGKVPRELQCLADIVGLADIITGDEESWSLSHVMDILVNPEKVLQRKPLCYSWIKEESLLPVYIGKQRPLVSIISEYLEEELEKLGATPLISTPEGMLFLVKNPIDVSKVYEKISEFIESLVRESSGGQQEKAINLSLIKDFLNGGKRKRLSAYSRTYTSIAGYSIKTLERTFEEASLTPEDLRLFIVVLAYIYSKDPMKKEGGISRIRRYLDSIGIPSIAGKNIEEILINLYRYLQDLNFSMLKDIAEKAKNFIIGEMRKLRTVETPTLAGKLEMYIGIGRAEKITTLRATKRCAVCRDPVISEKSLSSYLQELRKDAIKGINISEIFHPDVQGKPEGRGSIEKIGKLVVCEVCYFEAMSYRQIGHTDGLWARVLVYYPAISIDLMKAVKRGMEKVLGSEVRVLSDYMTSRVIVTTGSNMLTRSYLEEAIRLWYVFGGNLVVTTTAVSSAFAWRGLPVELEVSDAIVEEAISKYVEILENIVEFGWFTKEIRYWLYTLLKTYLRQLEEKKSKTSSLKFSRSSALATGYPTIDVFSLLMKQ